ncbi:LCP family protein [[Clostridium] scindens]|uniref:LCP family protein n=1 Tax=Clostridium scindens (strain JCM 10418 / VPI 12708) TaxID=29347 RepID=UPI0022E102EB|nr:LCP family protein [[Clostridium] scindens]
MSKKKRMKNRMTRAERQKLMRKRRRKRIALLVTEVLILSALCVTAYGIFKLDKLDFNILNDKNLEAYKDTGPYTNIALFGLDSRNDELDGGVQSDCIMIASINNDTSDVTLTSIYRDTLLQQKGGTYEKANSAYNRGGPEEAISLLNRNFDLDIHNYVSVNFTALVNTIDLLGGLELDMTAEEADWCNKYAVETAEVAGKDWEDIEVKDGTQKVDGVHAVAYARIRYTEGMDFKRAERQRIVLEKTAEKAKKANLLTLNKMIDEIFPMISTSFSTQDLLGFAANALNYNIVQTGGFPYQVTTREDVRNHEGSYVVPIGFTNNVTQLHRNLFKEDSYEPSEKVTQINDDIIYLTGVTEDTDAMNTTFEGDISNEGAQ